LVVSLPRLKRSPRSIAPWYALGLLLLVLGLGGTTSLPRLLFGSQWEWLTYDRFSLWADVPLVLLLADAASSVLSSSSGGRTMARLAWELTMALLGVYALLAALVPALIQTEPPPEDPSPIVAFLSQGDNNRWRYLTLGFGDQNGILNAETTAGTIDGAFFTARRIPLLTESGIGQIDFSLLWDPNARLLRELLAHPGPHSLRWVFTRDPKYERILAANFWSPRQTLADGLQVWEVGEAVPPVGSPESRSAFLGIWWGTVPLATLIGAFGLAWALRRQDHQSAGHSEPQRGVPEIHAQATTGIRRAAALGMTDRMRRRVH
jgi:hypothetical protein